MPGLQYLTNKRGIGLVRVRREPFGFHALIGFVAKLASEEMIAEDGNIGAAAAVIVAGEVVLRRRERGLEVVQTLGIGADEIEDALLGIG